MKKTQIISYLVLLVVLMSCSIRAPGGRSSQSFGADSIEDTSGHIDDDQSAEDEDALIFGPGTYTVGVDIEPGVYDCIASSGFGVLRGDVAAFGEVGFVQTMGSAMVSVEDQSVGVQGNDSYSNLELTEGDVIYIEMSLHIKFVQR